MSQATNTLAPSVLSKDELLDHWQGHRRLTHKVIAAFPEKEFFNFSIGGMRTFSEITKELLGIAAPGIEEIVTGKTASFQRDFGAYANKEDFVKQWDEDSEKISSLWAQIPEERFQERIKAFGQYEGTVISYIQYYMDNEIHHRAQGYVYLRALGIEPPHFYDR
jgi:uncharacterized damage-inducible protein DinB